MGKHSPPPKSKHLKKKSPGQSARGPQSKARQEKIQCEYEYSLKELIVVALAGALLVLAHFLPVEKGWQRLLCYILPALVAAIETVRICVYKFAVGDLIQEDSLIILAAVGAFAIGEYTAGAAALIIYRAGKLTEALMLKKTRKAETDFADIRAVSANLETEDGVISLRPSQVQPGDIVIVAPGEIIPLDGIIIDGISSIDVSPLTGSEESCTAAPGSQAVSGCVNLTSYIKIKVTRPFSESTAVRIMELLEKPVGYKARLESFSARFFRLYTPVAAAAALVIGVIPPLFSGNWELWLRKAIIILLISGAGAPAVSVPLAYLGGMRSAARCGIIFKGSNFLDYLSKTQVMIFGKTGVITEGRYTVTDVFPEIVGERELISAAAEAERGSKHPIAKALREAAGSDLGEGPVMQVEEIPGKGVSALVDGHNVYVGTGALLEDHGIRYRVPARAGTAVHVAVDNRYWGYIVLSDKLRDGAFDALESLRHQGVGSMVMLTGDVRAVARPVASSLNFDMVKAELQPDAKISAVEYLLATKADNAALAFVGDGDEDAQAISRADVGIAMAALYSEGAIDNGDVISLSGDIRRLPLAMKIARLSTGAAAQNIMIALGVKLIILCLGMFGLVPLLAASLADTAAALLCLLNSRRTFRSDNVENWK